MNTLKQSLLALLLFSMGASSTLHATRPLNHRARLARRALIGALPLVTALRVFAQEALNATASGNGTTPGGGSSGGDNENTQAFTEPLVGFFTAMIFFAAIGWCLSSSSDEDCEPFRRGRNNVSLKNFGPDLVSLERIFMNKLKLSLLALLLFSMGASSPLHATGPLNHRAGLARQALIGALPLITALSVFALEAQNTNTIGNGPIPGEDDAAVPPSNTRTALLITYCVVFIGGVVYRMYRY